MKHIIKIQDQLSGICWYYSAITAALNHIENPVDITNRRWSQIVKEKGYPFDHSGCTISRVRVWSVPDVKADNPAVI